MISALQRLENGNLELTANIPWEKVKIAKQKKLQELAQEITVKGFRPGKAPIDLAEKQIDAGQLMEKTLGSLLPEIYLETVKEHNLHPIISPRAQLVSAEENKDWQVKFVTTELPAVKLGDYKKTVTDSLAADKIWTPDKGKEKPEEKPAKEEERLGKIFKILLEKMGIALPEILIEEEVNRMLSQLIDQTAKLGLTIEAYLNSIGKTSEQLRTEYKQQAEETIKLELILATIADEEKIEIADLEVEKMIAGLPDEKDRQKMASPNQRAYIRQILRKRSVIDNLLKLN